MLVDQVDIHKHDDDDPENVYSPEPIWEKVDMTKHYRKVKYNRHHR
jgi:hypothetical protein